MIGHPAPPQTDPGPPPREAVQRWRLVLAREALEPDLAASSRSTAWEAALAASGLPIAGLDGPRARPRFAVAAPLSAAIPGEAELVDVWLTERLPRWRVREGLAGTLPPGYTLVDLHDVWLGEAPLPGRVSASVYRAVLAGAAEAPGALGAEAIRLAAAALLATTTLPMERRKGETTVNYDLRFFVMGIEVDDEVASGVAASGAPPAVPPAVPAAVPSAQASAPAGVTVRMTLRHDPEKGIGRPAELIAALADRTGVPVVAVALVRERLVLAEPPVVDEPAASARGPRTSPAGDAARRFGRRPGPAPGR